MASKTEMAKPLQKYSPVFSDSLLSRSRSFHPKLQHSIHSSRDKEDHRPWKTFSRPQFLSLLVSRPFSLLLQRIRDLMATNIRGFVTSRPHDSKIRSIFEGAISLKLSSHDEDIEIFLRARLSTRSLAAGLVETIVSRVLENAAGVYIPQSIEPLHSNSD